MRLIIILSFFLQVIALDCYAVSSHYGTNNGYVAKNDGVKEFMEALSYPLGKNIIVSKSASQKKISGTFNFDNPEIVLDNITKRLGLVWYSNGSIVYVYSAGEMKNAMISLRSKKLKEFKAFLINSGIYDEKFKLKGDLNSSTFFVTAPPVYIELIKNTAETLDKQSNNFNDMALGEEKISIVRLKNTFVEDRNYTLRNDKITIPGIANTIKKFLTGDENKSEETSAFKNTLSMPDMPSDEQMKVLTFLNGQDEKSIQAISNGPIKIISYPETNSILIKGPAVQVDFIERLIYSLDEPKRHIELSLWIIDINKNDLNQLGVDWSGQASISNTVGFALNSDNSVSTLDGVKFIASVLALEKKNKAYVVSRPVILTQENVPAVFDNNRTFYAKLVGERTSNLEGVTYGTLISVLPRFSDNNEIEMHLNIEDGRESSKDTGDENDYLPEVGRTIISTIARVPEGKSLLIGGYSRDSETKETRKIPVLGSIPLIGKLFQYKGGNNANTIRIFLIQPREITMRDANMVPFKEMSSMLDSDNKEQIEKWIYSYLSR
ncbi:EscC/YscC/HrcC family type III secretion system outer membrane ring protein [Escherichia coli]|uniref:type III secretion system outer membrane ring subunit SctC n=1 Tax=Escherichia coli TaxID=562 RepID=UPI00058A4B38|nr:type III secretion system outer membrane ring subunit SctC [Escherichia coli]EAC1404460.1 EscC/YscC/HrcC family type III secretion system outer membrane ring protein [Escherichia coli]EEW6031703.1 EscC/YscC/HrcC family type III secretion system outer membrane ring protein [Escherichia coli]EFC4873404.1 EscC/YscC/HrcC family type III secretion system outer membrane ring protein [Escherichia coli]EFN9261333.1 EscC/YscC/HrcC family type III secretion system outer membrane ring protein [Escheric